MLLSAPMIIGSINSQSVSVILLSVVLLSTPRIARAENEAITAIVGGIVVVTGLVVFLVTRDSAVLGVTAEDDADSSLVAAQTTQRTLHGSNGEARQTRRTPRNENQTRRTPRGLNEVVRPRAVVGSNLAASPILAGHPTDDFISIRGRLFQNVESAVDGGMAIVGVRF